MIGFEDIEARLANWSRVQRSGGRAGGSSSTHQICVYLNMYFGSPDNYARDGHTGAIDEKDAELIEKAVCALPTSRRRDVVAIWIKHPHCHFAWVAKKLGVSRRILEGSYRDALRLLREDLEARARRS
jgi:hypothetical protein